MKRYNPTEIEPKWQKVWEDKKASEAINDLTKQKIYISPMFPYPSGAGMHTGHAFEHSIVDAVARFYRQHDKNVMNPMGWDAFGLPTENYAIKTGISPVEATNTFISNFKKQIKRIGSSIDWSREINTSDPEYYRWTQWVFTKLFERGLAYQKEALQWWCPVDKTVLANEQVEGGHCWRCGSAVEKKSMKQWFFKITDYADALLDEIDGLDWPQKIKTAQTNWIGKSQGAEINFELVFDDGSTDETHLTVFTTRPDTIFGASFMVVAPEHPWVMRAIEQKTVLKNNDAVAKYVRTAVAKSEIERQAETKEKTGVQLEGVMAVNPATGEKIPVWVADYVLGGYGTGAIMAVPAHDERDNAFAEKYRLPIIKVVESESANEDVFYHGEGVLVNSGDFSGQRSEDAREQIVTWLKSQARGKSKTTYKMRDWLISRQRYWGAPIPIIHCDEHGAVAVPEKDLPVVLPEIEDFAPKGDGKSTLARAEEWVNTTCPECGKPAKRETDTMDGYACSSWYLLRYGDPNNSERAWDPEIINYWNPLDFYVGGDHAVAHLLYVRFWTHVFHDMGLVNFKEPVKKLVYHGYINAEDGRKMSKSLGNVIDPLDIINQGYGADALRTYLLFMGPIELDASWDSKGIAGVFRFLSRVWTLAQQYIETDKKDVTKNDEAIRRAQHKTIKKVTDDIRRLSFNTAIAALMEYTNDLYKFKIDGYSDVVWKEALETLVQMIHPFAPHMSEELWNDLGYDDIVQRTHWPVFDEALTVESTIQIAIQVNGKLRGQIEIAKDADEVSVKAAALAHENVAKFIEGEPKKVIYVPGRLVSVVV